MVRRMVGVLVEIGRGKLDRRGRAALDERFIRGAGAADRAASGLFLERVYYERDRAQRGHPAGHAPAPFIAARPS